MNYLKSENTSSPKFQDLPNYENGLRKYNLETALKIQ